MRLGFLGTGHITAAMVTGLASSEHRIWVSPRTAEIAADLARRLSRVTVAATNQDVIDQSEIVVLALPPKSAAGVLAELEFRADTRVLSVISSLAVQRIAPLVAPATEITRAVPLPSVADRAGPTAVYPPRAWAARLFDAMGMTIQVGSEREFEAFCAVTATIASYLAFGNTIASWLTRRGVAESEAHTYVRAMIRGVVNGDAGAAAHATPGGINEQLLRHLAQHRVLEHLSDGLDAVLDRITC